MDSLEQTTLHALHVALGATLVPFSGYAMPVHFPMGVLAEHRHTRAQAGLFDVSHMGQFELRGGDPCAAMETLVPGDIRSLAPGRQRYTVFTDCEGGILDDLIVGHAGDHLRLVVNAARKADDLRHLETHLSGATRVRVLADRALLALQGPSAAAVMDRLAPGADALRFMAFASMGVGGIACLVARCGYTGEDGFEISVSSADAEALARRFLAEPEVAPVGLGARDSLRLEAGLCLYGNDIDRTTSPVEAGLAWTIAGRRRRDRDFLGAAPILRQLDEGPARRRVGLRPLDQAPARARTVITTAEGRAVGAVTSGGFGPTLGGPLAMGYVESPWAVTGSTVMLVVRGTPRPARVVEMPFVPHRYRN